MKDSWGHLLLPYRRRLRALFGSTWHGLGCGTRFIFRPDGKLRIRPKSRRNASLVLSMDGTMIFFSFSARVKIGNSPPALPRTWDVRCMGARKCRGIADHDRAVKMHRARFSTSWDQSAGPESALILLICTLKGTDSIFPAL